MTSTAVFTLSEKWTFKVHVKWIVIFGQLKTKKIRNFSSETGLNWFTLHPLYVYIIKLYSQSKLRLGNNKKITGKKDNRGDKDNVVEQTWEKKVTVEKIIKRHQVYYLT